MPQLQEIKKKSEITMKLYYEIGSHIVRHKVATAKYKVII